MGKAGVLKNGHQFFESALHDGLVIEAIKDIENLKAVVVSLMWPTADDAHGGEKAIKWLGVLDSGWVIKGEDAKNVSGVETCTGLLDKLHDTVFRSDERTCTFS